MRSETILIVDDEKLIRWSLGRKLIHEGFSVIEADTVEKGFSWLNDAQPDLMILDQLLPDGTGIDVLERMTRENVQIPVIMLTAIDRSDVAVQAMKLGAIDYVTKPVNDEELMIVITKALESTRLKRQVAHFLREQEKSYGFCGMIGSSPPMKKTFDYITKIAKSSGTTVLITGESGTGKELAAQAVHYLSDRREHPLLTVNLLSLTDTLIESELFGHEKGAFTDAKSQRKGVFEIADSGTIFLDEIGDISPRLQVKLLRVMEQKTFQRVGATKELAVDVRIIAATNRPLEALVEEKKFRSDLYYRLNVASIVMPPLRERGDDILLLAEYFLHEYNTKFHKHFKGFHSGAAEIIRRYPWPGNVREMKNMIERAVLLHDGELVGPDEIELSQEVETPAPIVSAGPEESSLSLAEMEKQALLQALERERYNQSRAARLLKISRDTLRYRMKKYNLPGR